MQQSEPADHSLRVAEAVPWDCELAVRVERRQSGDSPTNVEPDAVAVHRIGDVSPLVSSRQLLDTPVACVLSEQQVVRQERQRVGSASGTGRRPHPTAVRSRASSRSCVEVDHPVEQGECRAPEIQVEVIDVPCDAHRSSLGEGQHTGHRIVCVVLGVCAFPVAQRTIDGNRVSTHRRAGVLRSREVREGPLRLRLDHHSDVGGRITHVRHCQVEQVALMNQRR